MPSVAIPMDVPPYRLSGVVYGTLLNHRTALAALGAAVDQPPYQRAPRAPVLYLKPRNTLAVSGAPVAVPAGVDELEIGAALGLVIGRTACRLSPANALEHLAGYLIVNDVSVPHLPYYRPSVRCKARDGFCPLGPRVVPRTAVANPDALTIRVYVDGERKQAATTAELLRSTARLLAEVTDFMTLAPGDVLAAGAASPAPRVRAGQCARIEIEELGFIESPFVAGAA
ncbi:MAG: fumarylacetoacetate hydrolase family protein [Gammaproteobacteria bacterium]|nr:fumarylacetoacetate hydrolase family protein [Gammaproteobacteria bacterium]